MEMTRRQFVLAALAGIGAFLFGGFLKLFGRAEPKIRTKRVRAMYWSRGRGLAG